MAKYVRVSTVLEVPTAMYHPSPIRLATPADAVAIQPPFCQPTGPDANCGWSLPVAAAYFVSFFILSTGMLVALLTAVILDAYTSTMAESGTQVRKRDDWFTSL